MNEYRGYVDAEIGLRQRKAEKIRRLLASRVDLSGADVLDLGAGSGHICRYLRPFVRTIAAADRDVTNFVADGVDIMETQGVSLPFPDARFDVVIYNHVLEHVGDRAAQRDAIAEVRRVLRPGGVLYLAIPNRWTVIEPHFRLPFLSWLPQAAADRYVRWLSRGTWYDCNPFGRAALLRSLHEAAFTAEDIGVEAVRAVLDIERRGTIVARALRHVPDRLIASLRSAMPTFIVIARKRGGEAALHTPPTNADITNRPDRAAWRAQGRGAFPASRP